MGKQRHRGMKYCALHHTLASRRADLNPESMLRMTTAFASPAALSNAGLAQEALPAFFLRPRLPGEVCGGPGSQVAAVAQTCPPVLLTRWRISSSCSAPQREDRWNMTFGPARPPRTWRDIMKGDLPFFPRWPKDM